MLSFTVHVHLKFPTEWGNYGSKCVQGNLELDFSLKSKVTTSNRNLVSGQGGSSCLQTHDQCQTFWIPLKVIGVMICASQGLLTKLEHLQHPSQRYFRGIA